MTIEEIPVLERHKKFKQQTSEYPLFTYERSRLHIIRAKQKVMAKSQGKITINIFLHSENRTAATQWRIRGERESERQIVYNHNLIDKSKADYLCNEFLHFSKRTIYVLKTSLQYIQRRSTYEFTLSAKSLHPRR